MRHFRQYCVDLWFRENHSSQLASMDHNVLHSNQQYVSQPSSSRNAATSHSHRVARNRPSPHNCTIESFRVKPSTHGQRYQR